MTEIFDLTTLKRHDFRLTFGSAELGPLTEAPEIRFLCRRHGCTVLQNGSAANACFAEDISAEVAVRTGNVSAALNLLAAFRKGDDLLGTSCRKSLVFTPLVASGVPENILTFGNAALIPEAGYWPETARDHTVKLYFQCIADPSTGVLFTYSATSL